MSIILCSSPIAHVIIFARYRPFQTHAARRAIWRLEMSGWPARLDLLGGWRSASRRGMLPDNTKAMRRRRRRMTGQRACITKRNGRRHLPPNDFALARPLAPRISVACVPAGGGGTSDGFLAFVWHVGASIELHGRSVA